MHCFAALAVLLTILAVSQAGMEEEIAKSKELMIKCKEETGATEDVDELMRTRDIPSTHAGKCMVACSMEKRGTIKNGRVDVEAIIKYIKSHLNGDKEKQEKASKMVAKCASIDVEALDKCEAAVTYLKCAKDNGWGA